MGLLTKIFGNREDGEAGADEGAEQSVESSEMREPDDNVQSQPAQVPVDTSNSGSDTPQTAKRVATAQPAPRSQPPRARAARRSVELQEQRDLATGRVARPPAQQADAALKIQPAPGSSTARNLQTGRKLNDVAASSTSTRSTTRALPSGASELDAAPSTVMPIVSEARDQADDSEEIDVSDQLEAVDDGEPADDLDPSDDLIIEEDEEEETSTSVSAWAVANASAEYPPVPVSRDEKIDGHALGLGPETVSSTRDIDVEDIHVEDSDVEEKAPSEPATPDPGGMRMPSQMKTPKQTLVEAGTEFKGTLKSSCPVAVNGTIDGEIDAPTLNIASSGSILGNVRAKTLRSQGTLSGKVDAEEVFLSGAVRSKTFIKTKRLEMKLGSLDNSQLEITFGNCDIELSDL